MRQSQPRRWRNKKDNLQNEFQAEQQRVPIPGKWDSKWNAKWKTQTYNCSLKPTYQIKLKKVKIFTFKAIFYLIFIIIGLFK